VLLDFCIIRIDFRGASINVNRFLMAAYFFFHDAPGKKQVGIGRWRVLCGEPVEVVCLIESAFRVRAIRQHPVALPVVWLEFESGIE
jgi:hypothetical protein